MRANLILISVFLFAMVIIGRLAYIQIKQHDFYSALAQGQQRFFIDTKGERGEVFFRYHQPLAINKTFFYVFASPVKIVNHKETAEILSQKLNLPKDFILSKINKENSHFELLKKRLTQDEITYLEQKKLPGIYFGKELLRYYPQNFLASQLIGFVGGDNKGQYGVEGYYNEILQGQEGFKSGQRDVFGRVLGQMIEGGGNRGQDIVLTLDYNIQFTAEKLLEEAYNDFNIKSGQIIVLSPNSGEILAIANFPNFNPNEFSNFNELAIFKNPATQKIFEPGSVMKTFTKAIALEQRKITPETTYIDEGKIEVGNHIIRNFDHRQWGKRTMTEVLAKSINTGSVYAAQLVGLEPFVKYLERFGFFNLTGIDLQGEVAFHNNELRKGGREINLATASFGHGISITPIQLARAFAIIANQGRMVYPRITKNIKEKDISKEQVISKETALKTTTMLVETVNHRWNRRAQVPGYYVAGKTGTAEIPWRVLGYNKPGYSDRLIQTFVGFAPAYNPQFLIMVKLDQPQGVRTATESAAPIFQKMARHIINLWQIPPDYDVE